MIAGFLFLRTVKVLSPLISYQEFILMAVLSFDSDPSHFLDLVDLCFPVLKTECQDLDVAVDVSFKEV